MSLESLHKQGLRTASLIFATRTAAVATFLRAAVIGAIESRSRKRKTNASSGTSFKRGFFALWTFFQRGLCDLLRNLERMSTRFALIRICWHSFPLHHIHSAHATHTAHSTHASAAHHRGSFSARFRFIGDHRVCIE